MGKRTDIFTSKNVLFSEKVGFFLKGHLLYSQQPADKGANAKTKATLDFIAGLPKQGMFILDYYSYFYL